MSIFWELVSYLQQCLSYFRVLRTVKVQHLGAQSIIVGSHLVQVHHIGVCIEHSPPALSVHFGKFDRQHSPLSVVQSLGQPQGELHLGTLSRGEKWKWGKKKSHLCLRRVWDLLTRTKTDKYSFGILLPQYTKSSNKLALQLQLKEVVKAALGLV